MNSSVAMTNLADTVLNERFVSKGLPIVVGEFGAFLKSEPLSRWENYDYLIKNYPPDNTYVLLARQRIGGAGDEEDSRE